MSVKGSQYAKSYFLLRTLGAKDSPDFDMQPLAEAKATRLAERCLGKQMQVREQYPEDGFYAERKLDIAWRLFMRG